MPTRTGRAPCGEIELFYEDLGDLDDPPVMLIMGVGAQLPMWPDGFCERLIKHGYRVIRFDHRDTGLSTKMRGMRAKGSVYRRVARYLFGRTSPVPYTLVDLADDVAKLLDHLEIDKAHVVGASMGGMIAQVLAGSHPQRVSSLAVIMSSTGKPLSSIPRWRLITRPFQAPAKDATADERLEYEVRNISLFNGPNFLPPVDQLRRRVIDLTERKQAEEKLHASEQRFLEAQMELAHVTRVTTLGELTASIAHEVNQPLSAVAANAEACLRWLDRATPDLDAVRRSVEWVIDDNNRAAAVIQRVRALAKKDEIEKVPLDINDLVREVIALVQRELISHQVSLRMELTPALPMIPGDRVQLQQVIINLVMNGIEAMQSVTDRPRELVIRSGQDEKQHVLASVTDCGVGIPAQNADRLFNAFFTTKSNGMGMGLSICRSIMEAHGNRL